MASHSPEAWDGEEDSDLRDSTMTAGGTRTAPTEDSGMLPEIDPSEIEFDEKIGEGSYGQVFSGKCRGKDVAIKGTARPRALQCNENSHTGPRRISALSLVLVLMHEALIRSLAPSLSQCSSPTCSNRPRRGRQCARRCAS